MFHGHWKSVCIGCCWMECSVNPKVILTADISTRVITSSSRKDGLTSTFLISTPVSCPCLLSKRAYRVMLERMGENEHLFHVSDLSVQWKHLLPICPSPLMRLHLQPETPLPCVTRIPCESLVKDICLSVGAGWAPSASVLGAEVFLRQQAAPGRWILLRSQCPILHLIVLAIICDPEYQAISDNTFK